MPRPVLVLAGAMVALGCLSIIAEIATGLALRGALGLRNEPLIFKRSVTAILLVSWPLAALLVLDRRRALAAALGVLLTVAAVMAHSSAALLGLLAGTGAILLAQASRRAVAGLLALAIVGSFAVAPILGSLSARVIPERAFQALANAHARERVAIWQSFGEIVRLSPGLGAGFGTSATMAANPLAAQVPEEDRVLLGAWHAHNAPLQIWAETGFAGALIVGATLLLLALALARSRSRSAADLAVACSAFAIMMVSHGAWQGWWVTTLGAAAIWTARLGPDQPAGAEPR